MIHRLVPTIALGAAIALAATACIPKSEETRIGEPPDTRVTFGEEPPTAGVFAGGGTFQLSNVRIGVARCSLEDTRDPFQSLFKDPLNTQSESERINVPEDRLPALAAFIGSVTLRVAEDGKAIVLGAETDPSTSLPYSGDVRGGAVTRLDASSLIVAAGDRAASLRVEVDGAPDAGTPAAAPTESFAFDWKERSSVDPWLLGAVDGDGDCNADATAEVLRTGPAPAAVSGRPAGPATVLSVGGGVPAQVIDLINQSQWIVDDDGRAGLELGSGQALATGEALENAGAWIVILNASFPDVAFEFRGAKTEDGSVSGQISAGGVSVPIVLSG